MQVSAINLETASGSAVTQKKIKIFYLFISPTVLQSWHVPIFGKELCEQMHWRLNWGLWTENNLPRWILPQLLPLLCSHSALLLETDLKHRPLQYVLYASFVICLECLKFWSANFSCWSTGKNFLTLVLAKSGLKLGEARSYKKWFHTSLISEKIILGKLSNSMKCFKYYFTKSLWRCVAKLCLRVPAVR